MLVDERDDGAETTTATPTEPVPGGRSRWDIGAPLLVTWFAVGMFGWNVARNQWSNEYYAAAVRSMGTSWHAFWYASVDAGGWVTSFSFGPTTNGSPYGASDFTEDTLRWLDTQRTTETWSIAMSSAFVGEDATIEGHRVLAVGGFSGGDHAGSATRVADAVASGRLRFFLAGGARFDLQEPDVFAVVRSVCTRVPSPAWGGHGLSGVYDCQGKANALRGTES